MHTANPSADNDQTYKTLLVYSFQLLAKKALTESELRSKLKKRTTNNSLVDMVILRIKELGHLDDSSIVTIESGRTNISGFRLKQRLQHRGVQEELIEKALQQREKSTDILNATTLLNKRWPLIIKKKNPKASAYTFLARRGFTSEVIWQVIKEKLK
jgi:regulatory protein